MKIVLKKLKVNEEFSEETLMFKADVYINGTNVGEASNDGRGGCTYISGRYYGDTDEITKEMQLIDKARKYCDSLPKRKYDEIPDKEFDITLEDLIDDLVDEKLREKEEKKIKKLCEKKIVWGRPNYSYSYMGFKSKKTLNELIGIPQGKIAVEKLYNDVKSKLKDGEVIFNTNLNF